MLLISDLTHFYRRRLAAGGWLRAALRLLALLSALFTVPLATLAQGSGAPVESGLSTYPLGAGDVISIRVFDEDDFTQEKIRLTDAGTIFFPSVGEIRINGLTLGGLEQRIADGLRGRILINPRVSVEINEYRPFYINGMVKSPGSYRYQPGLTVRKAATLAGGFQERASMKKIFMIREGDATQTPQRIDLDTPIGPGDLVTIEESFF